MISRNRSDLRPDDFELIEKCTKQAQACGLFDGLLLHGSSQQGQNDVYSDLDFVCLLSANKSTVSDEEMLEFMKSLGEIAVTAPVRLGAQARVYLCLYMAKLARVDFTVATRYHWKTMVEKPMVLWDRTDGELTKEIDQADFSWPKLDPDDLDSRFWLCVEQAVRRLGRGECFEILDILGIMRSNFLGPMLFRQAGLAPHGVRRIEAKLPRQADLLKQTLASAENSECRSAILASINIYRKLREDFPPSRSLAEIEEQIENRMQKLK
jgi:hypothetical protein